MMSLYYSVICPYNNKNHNTAMEVSVEYLNNLKSKLIDKCSSISPQAESIINSCIDYINQCNTLFENNNIADINNINFIKSVMLRAEQLLACDNDSDMNDENWDKSVPEAFLFKNTIGYYHLDQSINEINFDVRGKNYLKDKIKVPSPPPLFRLHAMQFIENSSFIYNVGSEDWCVMPKNDPFNEWFVLNYMVPGRTCVHVVCIFSAAKETLEVIRSMKAPNAKEIADKDTRGWARSIRRFWSCDKEYCDRHFKLFPRAQEASWAIHMAVGKKPALVGYNRLTLQYHRGLNYMEVDLDMSSSSIATRIIGMVRGVSKSLVVDMGAAIEGLDEDELPEVMLCQMRMKYMNIDKAEPLRPFVATISKAPTPNSTPVVHNHHSIDSNIKRSDTGVSEEATASDSFQDEDR